MKQRARGPPGNKRLADLARVPPLRSKGARHRFDALSPRHINEEAQAGLDFPPCRYGPWDQEPGIVEGADASERGGMG